MDDISHSTPYDSTDCVLSVNQLVGMPVVTAGGERLGSVHDVLIDHRCGVIISLTVDLKDAIGIQRQRLTIAYSNITIHEGRSVVLDIAVNLAADLDGVRDGKGSRSGRRSGINFTPFCE